MSYHIMIFNQKPLGRFSGESLLAAITTSNYHTLCAQYGLNPGLIQPALDQLSLEMNRGNAVPFFVLRYGPQHQPPLVVTRWDALTSAGRQRLLGFAENPVSADVRERLMRTRELVTVELVEAQLADLGLLLAYEIARWAAVLGSGVVYGLDGCWYAMNAQHAFVSLADRENRP
ncbi:MAG: hypothetical protein K0B06_06060 [Brevefilum sp.]|nr:hypothetical protein [Brevefilum sp.]